MCSNTSYMRYFLLVILLIINQLVFSQETNDIGNSIFSLVKKIRENNKIKSEIFMTQTLCDAAKIQAEYILNSGNVTHDNPTVGYKTKDDRVLRLGYRSGVKENITYLNYNGETNDSLARRAVNNFMNSSPHRFTLLSGDELNIPIKTAYGQSILYDINRNKIVVVQLFVQCFYSSDLLIK